MSSPGAGRSSDFHWYKLYEAAVLEINIAKLPGRVEQAKEAIQSRMRELASSDQNSEWQPLTDALNMLDDLLKMQKARQPEPHKAEH
jgi:surfactin synthase thioesterase subunit